MSAIAPFVRESWRGCSVDRLIIIIITRGWAKLASRFSVTAADRDNLIRLELLKNPVRCSHASAGLTLYCTFHHITHSLLVIFV